MTQYVNMDRGTPPLLPPDLRDWVPDLRDWVPRITWCIL